MADQETRGNKADQGALSAKNRWGRIGVSAVVLVVLVVVAGRLGWFGPSSGVRSAAALLGAVAWPAVVGGALIFVLVEYREHIGRLIDHISEVKSPWGSASIAPRQNVNPDAGAPKPSPALDEDLKKVAAALLASFTAGAHRPTPEVLAPAGVGAVDVGAAGPRVANDVSLSKDEATLARLEATEAERDALRLTAGRLALERIYAEIYGSQMQALWAIQSAEPDGLSRADIERFYAGAHKLIRSSVSFDVWLQFLTARGLINPTEDGHYHLALKGRAFLRMINENPGFYPEKMAS